MHNLNWVYALSIEERIKILKNVGKNVIDYSKLREWEMRKSLCTGELFEKSLNMRNLTRDDFAIGLQELSIANKEILYEYVKTMEWFNIHNKCFEHHKDNWDDLTIKDFSYVLRYHMQYISDSVNRIFETYKENINVTNKEFILQKYLLELLTISMKTLVADMHTHKQTKEFVGCTAEERFAFYLDMRFGDRENVKNFFSEHPVLTRLLATRIIFQLRNLESYLRALLECKDKIQDVFGLTTDLIKIISMGAGDSHEDGKSVIIFEVKDVKLVFKYKELQIGEAYNEFLRRFEHYSKKSDFIKVKRIIGNGYTIEEFISHEECTTQDEIKEYYYKFGEQIAISYMLCVNDLHYENVIAHGKYPVIIDVETMIQNVNPIETDLTAIKSVMYQGMESILGTGLLPTGNFGRDKKGLRLSALNGGEQTLPFKVLKPINNDSDEMKFEYQTHKIIGADNLPKLNGKEENYENYKSYIVSGFSDAMNIFIAYKTVIQKDAEELFSNIVVRNVLKATQKYADMLDYGYHPKCMYDYVEREKLFENIWGYPYRNMEVVPFEIDDLLVNDIPIFFNNTSSKNIISSKGEIIKDYYPARAIDRTLSRISGLNNNLLQYQKNLLLIALNMFEGEPVVHALSPKYAGENEREFWLKQAFRIGDYLMERSVRGRDGTISWADIVTEDYENWNYFNIPINLYDGFSGIYLFFFYLNQMSPDKKYGDVLEVIEKMLLKEGNPNVKNLSVYEGRLSPLYPLYNKMKLCGYREYKEQIYYLLKAIEESEHVKKKDDWLTGKAGLIKVLVNIYKLSKDQTILNTAMKYALEMNLDNISTTGLAHGYSGVALALAELNDVLEKPDERLINTIDSCIKLENQSISKISGAWVDSREASNTNDVWCHGAAGIGMVRLRLYEKGYFDKDLLIADIERSVNLVVSANLNDDCLCHGNMGIVEFLSEIECFPDLSHKCKEKAKIKLTEILNLLKNGKYSIRGLEGMPNLGLMAGLSGIGYEFLRLYNTKIPNVLLLD